MILLQLPNPRVDGLTPDDIERLAWDYNGWVESTPEGLYARDLTMNGRRVDKLGPVAPRSVKLGSAGGVRA